MIRTTSTDMHVADAEASDDDEEEDEEGEGEDRQDEKEDDEALGTGPAAEVAEEGLSTVRFSKPARTDSCTDLAATDPIYCIGPSRDPKFLHRHIHDNINTEDLHARRTRIPGGRYFSAPVDGTRYVYRMINCKEALDDWDTSERGETTVSTYDITDKGWSIMLDQVTNLMRARWFVRSGELDKVKLMDEAEEAFITSITEAKKLYAGQLSKLGFLPADWRSYASE